jgi:hypothetical protein
MFWTHSALRENAVVTLKARKESPVIKIDLSTIKTDDFHPILGLTGASNSAASAAKQLPGGVRPGGMVEQGYLLDVEFWFKFNMVKRHKFNGASSFRLKGFKGRTC